MIRVPIWLFLLAVLMAACGVDSPPNRIAEQAGDQAGERAGDRADPARVSEKASEDVEAPGGAEVGAKAGDDEPAGTVSSSDDGDANTSNRGTAEKDAGAAEPNEDDANEADAVESDAAENEPKELPPPRVEYLGRRIARTMHWRGAEWLLRETREDEENATRLLVALGIEEGQTVCDLGCGNGFHTLPMAELVGPEGRVLAVDIQEQMLGLLERRLRKRGIENVEKILGGVADPNLPPNSCDLILLVDVYHEISYPERVLRSMRRALKPGGRVALVEFRTEDPDVPIKPLHKMSKAQMRLEFESNGFKVVEQFDELPWQHLMFFGRAD